MVNKNSMLYWWPLIQIADVPTPETYFCSVDTNEVKDTIEDLLEYPVFIRTDLSAGKHSWDKSCFVQNADEVDSHIRAVIRGNEMWHLLGIEYSAIVVREFLELESTFTAFSDNMPINIERRYFINSGKIICHHPYWPPETFEWGHPERLPHDPDWRTKLDAMNMESEQEIALLTGYAQRIGEVMPEHWSVDFAKTRQGKWYLIDMALGENSFHWPNCSKVRGQPPKV